LRRKCCPSFIIGAFLQDQRFDYAWEFTANLVLVGFQLITVPVEFRCFAARRKIILREMGIVQPGEELPV